MFDCLWQLSQSFKRLPVLDLATYPILPTLPSRFCVNNAGTGQFHGLAHLQSNIKIQLCGPRQLNDVCEGNGTQGPRPPMIVQANGCRPSESFVPSSSTIDEIASISQGPHERSTFRTVDETLEQQEEKVSS